MTRGSRSRPDRPRRAPDRGTLAALLVASALASACATSGRVAVRPVEFFPGPADASVQRDARDAVGLVLRGDGFTVVADDATGELVAVGALPCGAGKGVALRVAFARSAGTQALGVLLCREVADGVACAEEVRGLRDARGCQQGADAMLSSLERRLAEYLAFRLAHPSPADGYPGGRPPSGRAHAPLAAADPAALVTRRVEGAIREAVAPPNSFAYKVIRWLSSRWAGGSAR